MEILELSILRRFRFLEFRDTSGIAGSGYVLNSCWGESAISSALSMGSETRPFGLMSGWKGCCLCKTILLSL